MKKIYAMMILGLVLSPLAKADIITCSFTEPFYTTKYSMAEQSLTIITPDAAPQVIENVSFQIKGANLFELDSKDGKTLQVLKLTNQGSDGMSDDIFPYEVSDVSQLVGPRAMTGGCESNFLRAKRAE